MPEYLIVILFFLSAHRITRFLIRDCFPLIAIPRDWILARTDPTEEDLLDGRKPRGAFMRSIGYLLQCEWCMSIWVSAGLVYGLTWFYTLTIPYMIGLWLAGSTVAALMSERVEDKYEGCDL